MFHTAFTMSAAARITLPSFFYTLLWGNPVLHYLISALILLAAFFLRKALARLMQVVIRLFAKKNRTAGSRLAEAVLPGLKLMVFAAGFSIATGPLLLKTVEPITAFLEKTGSTLFVVMVCLLLAGIATALTEISYDSALRQEKKVSQAIHLFYRQAIRIGAVILGLFMILKVWGFDISSLLTGIGIGGLAISLAAQETFANLIGGITIMADRAFEIGDYISTPDIDGVVETIGFRSSRIRTLTQAVVTVPNAKLSNSFITNFSRMGKRRIRFTVSVTYDTPSEKLEQLNTALRAIAARRSETVLEEGLLVYFEKLSSSSLDILFQCFVNTVAYDRYLAEQEAILFEVMKTLKDLDIEFAYPTTSVIVQEKELKT